MLGVAHTCTVIKPIQHATEVCFHVFIKRLDGTEQQGLNEPTNIT